MALHVNEFHIQPRHLFRNKNCVFGPSSDDPKQLAKLVLVFLLSTLTGKKISINLGSKQVHNLKTEFLKSCLMRCLDKAIECGYKILPIILDGALTNAKVLRITNKAMNPATNGNPTPNA